MLERIYSAIKNEIQQLPLTIPVVIYTGVGTFAGLKNEQGMLEPQNYHQFPPFLQELYRIIPHLQMYLVLIDPCQEYPPYLTRDYPLVNPALDMYRNNTLTVYALRQRVYTAPHEPIEDAVDITAALRNLNTFAIANNICTFYHSFTGVRNNVLAEYFDPELNSAVDHIIYGLSLRRDHGCYFDLTDAASYMPYRLVGLTHTRTHLQFYNYYKYLVNGDYAMGEREKALYPMYMQSAIQAQKDQITAEQKQHFKVNVLSTLRVVYQMKVAAGAEEPPPQLHYFNLDYLPVAIKRTAEEYFHKKDYSTLYDYLLCYCGEKLEILAQLLQLTDEQNMTLDGHDLLALTTAHPNPYMWGLPNPTALCPSIVV